MGNDMICVNLDESPEVIVHKWYTYHLLNYSRKMLVLGKQMFLFYLVIVIVLILFFEWKL